MVVHTYNPSNQEVEEGGLLSLMLAWVILGVPISKEKTKKGLGMQVTGRMFV
jgi:hypothetical protein